MIGRIRGQLIEKKPPMILVEVNGVGYEIQVPMSTLYQLPETQNQVLLYTHLHVREDQHTLFGFHNDKERTLFRALIKISGVGPKMALTILSGMEVSAFVQCVEMRDYGPLVRLPGVGKKTAERLIIEMGGRLKNNTSEDFEFATKLFNPESSPKSGFMAENEAISALISLGYKPQEASRAVAKVFSAELNSQELIRRALQSQAKETSS